MKLKLVTKYFTCPRCGMVVLSDKPRLPNPKNAYRDHMKLICVRCGEVVGEYKEDEPKI